MKRAGFYARVSTQEQAQEGYSIPAQKEKGIAYCSARDYVLHDIYIDAGYSGANLDRPGIQKLIHDVMAGLLDVVIVYKLDRLSRSQKDTLYLIEDVFLKNNVDLVSMQESFDTSTPFGRAMVGILSVFAQLERESIRERSMMGQRERAKAGLHHGSRMSPIGYEFDGDNLVINEYEAAQVRLIYNLFIEGHSMAAIAKYMREAGFRHKYSNYRNTRTVANILSRAVYTGKIKYRNEYFDGQHEPIISEDTWNKVQDMLKKMRENQVKRSPSNDTLLKDLLYCQHCKGKFSRRHTGKNRLYYECYSRLGHPSYMVKDPNCKNLIWKVKELDAKVEKEIFELVSNRNKVNSIIKNENNDNNDEIKVLNNKIGKLNKQIERLMDLYQDDKFPIAELSGRIQKLYAEKKSLEDMLVSLNMKKQPVLNGTKLNDILDKVSKTWLTATMDEKRMMLQSLVKRIWVDWDDIRIEWAF